VLPRIDGDLSAEHLRNEGWPLLDADLSAEHLRNLGWPLLDAIYPRSTLASNDVRASKFVTYKMDLHAMNTLFVLSAERRITGCHANREIDKVERLTGRL
jgi:hypothetical protein